MVISKKQIGSGIAAAVVVVGAAVWLSGGFSAGKHGEPGMPQAVQEAKHDGDDGHGHNEKDAKATANLDPKEIEKKVCEHDIRQIDCQECRYELGVVKVDPSVTNALTNTTTVQEGDLGRTLRLTGEVQYDQTTLVDVLPAAAGKVVSVKARLGQKVQAGDVLAVIHSGDFGEAKAVYLEAFTVSEVAQQEKSRQSMIGGALEKLLVSAKEQPGSDIPAETLGEWKSKLVGAVARLRQAKVILEREKSLFAKQASSKAELENAERELQTTQADYTALLEEIQLNVKLDRLKAENAAKLAEAKLNAAEQRLHLFGMDDEAINKVPLMRENGRFAQLAVKAPRAGIITALNITEGKFIEASQSLYTIADTSNVWVWCDLYERDLGPLHERLSKGEQPRANVKVTAFPDTFAGNVDLLDSAVNETTRTVKVRVQVKNEQGKLRPGMFAAVDIPLIDGKKVNLVPRQAILSDEGKTFAFVHWKEDLWLRRDVSIGNPQGDMIEVLNGLSVGDKVVAGGGFLFKSDVLRAKMGAGCAD
jgi:multidrug efflux pump subunit AcrA (membrane-fusion protein)